MRRAASGWEADGVGGDIRATWSSETVSTAWTAVVDATAARTGGYGFHVTRSTASGALSVGGYESILLTSGNPRWTTAPDASATSTPFVGTAAGDPKRCWMRVYFKPVVVTAGASNNFFVLQLAGGSNVGVASIEFRTNTGFNLNLDGTTMGVIYNPSVGTWYRLELMVEYDHIRTSSSGDLHATGWVYTASGTTPLGYFSAHRTFASSTFTGPDRINVGYRVNTLQGNNAQEGYFDDFAVNDEKVASGQTGIHVASPWGGACRGVAIPSGAGSFAEWTIGGSAPSASNWQGVAEYNAFPGFNDGVTLNYTPAAVGTPRDAHHIQNPTMPGSEVVKSASVICRAQDLAGGFPYYKMGLYENSTELLVPNNQTGGWFHNCAAIGEVGGGGAWTNTKANGAEVLYRKTTSDATAQQEVSTIVVEWEDDDGLSTPPAAPVYQRKRGWEA